MSQSPGSRSDLRGGAVWMALGTAVVIEAFRMERFDSTGATLYTYPGFVPGLIGALVALLGFILMLRGWRARDRRVATQAFVNRRVLLALALSLGFSLLLLARVHFIAGTACFVAAFSFLFGDPAQALRRRVIVSALNGLITASVVFLVFQEIFLVRLP
ncbi:MAG: tripartite tricarboxylate transporter TctB family protein [Betaproteobacteria bacterium]|jgi:hypothetical protein